MQEVDVVLEPRSEERGRMPSADSAPGWYSLPAIRWDCREGNETAMRRFSLAFVAALALTLGVTGLAGAQTDLGNDGVDLNCADFPELNAAQGYFEGDGGSADRNVDNLDFDGDGNVCEPGDERVLARRDTDEQTGDDDDEEDTEDTGTLPNTGSGVTTGQAASGLLLALLGVSTACALASLGMRRQA